LKRRRIITLLTDFGVRDAYIATMKGVILGICPEAEIIDISHEVRKFDVRHGAFLLHQAGPYFPKGTVHMAVVDPGVGTERRRIIIEGERCLYVGPDNGVLSLAVEREGFVKAVEIKERKFMLPNLSATFEGRDIFAPVSAHLARGVRVDEFGPEVSGIVKPSFSMPIVGEDRIVGEALHIDGFGNIVTNIKGSHLNTIKAVEGDFLRVRVGEFSGIVKFSKTYGSVPTGAPVVVIGSSSFLEVSISQGSAGEVFKADVGNRIEIEK